MIPRVLLRNVQVGRNIWSISWGWRQLNHSIHLVYWQVPDCILLVFCWRTNALLPVYQWLVQAQDQVRWLPHSPLEWVSSARQRYLSDNIQKNHRGSVSKEVSVNIVKVIKQKFFHVIFSNCQFTVDRNLQNQSSAIIFHMPNLHWENYSYPSYRWACL